MTASPPDSTSWLEISIDVHPSAHEALSAFLFDLGCEGIVTEDFGGRTLKAYWPFRQDPEELRNRIAGFLADLGSIFPEARSSECGLRNLQDEDWGRSWRRFFHPDRVTPNLMIYPAWEPVPESIHGEVLRIDPGPAFGTGQHPTTRMCLRAMEMNLPTGPWSMLDVGTGSGILALYAARLGASEITAIDTDPEALRWAERNASLNGLGNALEISGVLLEDLHGTFSLVAANLILGTIVELFPFFPPVLMPGGALILSGLLREQAGRVRELAEDHGLRHGDTMFQEEWACVILKA